MEAAIRKRITKYAAYRDISILTTLEMSCLQVLLIIENFLENRRKDSIGISTLKSQNGNVITDPTGKAEILNHHFKLVFTI